MSIESNTMEENVMVCQPLIVCEPLSVCEPLIVCEPPKILDIDSQFSTIQQSLTKFKTYVSDIQQQLRTLEKSVKTAKKEEKKVSEAKVSEAKVSEAKVSEAKISEAKVSEAKVSEAKISEAKITRQSKITGFDIQQKITPALCAFMKLPPDSTTTRNAATLYITEYIRLNKLQDMNDRKCIHLNEEMATLFKLTDTKLTYFNLHKHISAHIL